MFTSRAGQGIEKRSTSTRPNARTTVPSINHHPAAPLSRGTFRRARPLVLCDLERLIGFIDLHLSGPLPVTRLAQVIGLGELSFYRASKSSTGQSPARFALRRWRERAGVVLLTTRIQSLASRSNAGSPIKPISRVGFQHTLGRRRVLGASAESRQLTTGMSRVDCRPSPKADLGAQRLRPCACFPDCGRLFLSIERGTAQPRALPSSASFRDPAGTARSAAGSPAESRALVSQGGSHACCRFEWVPWRGACLIRFSVGTDHGRRRVRDGLHRPLG